MTAPSTCAVRFRHSAGDLGPLLFNSTANIQTVKERLLSEWPRGKRPLPSVSAYASAAFVHAYHRERYCVDGSLGSDAPSCIADMKLILGGKFLDNSESLEGALRRPSLTLPHIDCQGRTRLLCQLLHLSITDFEPQG